MSGRLNNFTISSTPSDLWEGARTLGAETAALGQDDRLLRRHLRRRDGGGDLAGAPGESAADRVGGRADRPGRRDAAERERARAGELDLFGQVMATKPDFT